MGDTVLPSRRWLQCHLGWVAVAVTPGGITHHLVTRAGILDTVVRDLVTAWEIALGPRRGGRHGMSDDLEISGGAGGLGATYDDMLTFAGVLDVAADGLRETTGDLLRLGVGRAGELAEASLLVPDKVRRRGGRARAGHGLDGAAADRDGGQRPARAGVGVGLRDHRRGARGDAGGPLTPPAASPLGMGAIPLALTGSAALLVAASRNPALAARLRAPAGHPGGPRRPRGATSTRPSTRTRGCRRP